MEFLSSLQAKELAPYIGLALQGAAVAIALAYALGWLLESHWGKGRLAGPAFTWPLLGDTLAFMQSPVKYMWNRWVRYGGLFKTHLLGYTVYVPSTPAMLRAAWADDDQFEFFVPGKTFTQIISDIGHMTHRDKHALFRRKLGQAMSPAAVSTHLAPAMAALVSSHLDAWGAAGTVQLHAAVARLSLDISLDVVTGHPLPSDPAGAARVRQLYSRVMAGLYALPLPAWLPGSALRAALAAKRELADLVWPGVERQVAEIEDKVCAEEAAAAAVGAGAGAAEGEGADEKAAGAGGAAAAGGAPRLMMEAQVASSIPFGRLTRLQLLERALGNAVAAGDTSQHIFFTTIAATALAPRVKAALEEELREAMRKHGSDLPYSAIASLPYLDAVIKETMRLLPPAFGGFRVAKKDIPVDGGVIPKGGVVMWSTHIMHSTDPVLLPRTAPAAPGATAASTATAAGRRSLAAAINGASGLPAHMDYVGRFEEAFRPERWLAEETRPRQFTPFGGGLHLCLGMHIAYAEAKLLLAHLLRRFDFRLADPAVLAKARFFPGPKPAAGSDGLVLTPRDLLP